MSLRGQTLFITGASRGIGKAIAIRAAKDGANIAIVAKTTEEHPKLPGTIFTAAAEVEAAGGHAIAIQCDIRDEQQIKLAIEKTVARFGGIDIVINNASAIHLAPTATIDMKRYDLMHSINLRGTFAVSKLALPYLLKSRNPHILNLSPPLSMREHWFAPHVAYTMAKFGMSMCVLGMAGEFREHGIAVNALWPKTVIDTSALQILGEGKTLVLLAHKLGLGARGRTPEIMADAAYVILTQPSRQYTGHFTIDEDILRSQGVTDFSKFSTTPGNQDLMPDFFVDEDYTFTTPPGPGIRAAKSKLSATPLAKSSAVHADRVAIPGFKCSPALQRLDELLRTAEPGSAIYKASQSLNTLIAFDVTSVQSGKVQCWHLDTRMKQQERPAVVAGQSPANAAIILTVRDDVLWHLLLGDIKDDIAAYREAGMRIKGDESLWPQVERLIKAVRAVASNSHSKL